MIRRRTETGGVVVTLVWAVGVVIGVTLALRLAFDIDLLTYITEAVNWLERKLS